MKTWCIVCVVLLCSVNVSAETYLFVCSKFWLLSEETEHGEFQGIAIELTKTIAEKLGHTIRIEFYPWIRAQQMVKDGRADALLPPFKTPERDQWFDFMEIPLAPSNGYFFAAPGSTFVWDGDLSSLKEYTIGIPLGWSLGPEIEQAKAFLSIYYASNTESCLRLLLSHRVDFVPGPIQQIMTSFQHLGLPEDQTPVKIFPPFTENGAYLAFSKRKRNELAGLKKDFDRVLKEMTENSERARVLAKYKWPN